MCCGTVCLVSETVEPNVVSVRFPNVAGEPEDFEAKKAVIESILPCHLEVRYDFVWCTFDELADLTWDEAAEMTFLELALRNVE